MPRDEDPLVGDGSGDKARSPRWPIPDGDPPLATVPRFSVPSPKGKNGQSNKVEYVRFLEDNKEPLLSVLRHPVSDDQLVKSNSFQKRFFFVDRQFPQLHGAISPAQETLAEVVDTFSMPPARAVECLLAQDALSLPDILKFALSFEAATKFGHLGAITYFGLSAGNPLCPSQGKRVVPALRSADPKKLKAIRKSVAGTDEGFNAFLKLQGRNHVPPGFFTTKLEVGWTAGKGGRSGNYLLTEPTARLVHKYFVSCAENQEVVALDELLPSDPDKFPGNGLYCVPLPVKDGNFLS